MLKQIVDILKLNTIEGVVKTVASMTVGALMFGGIFYFFHILETISKGQ